VKQLKFFLYANALRETHLPDILQWPGRWTKRSKTKSVLVRHQLCPHGPHRDGIKFTVCVLVLGVVSISNEGDIMRSYSHEPEVGQNQWVASDGWWRFQCTPLQYMLQMDEAVKTKI
jgi:hypothetical protein